MQCCCDTGTTTQPRLVRAGWYHFAVMDTAGAVSVIIGEPQEIAATDYDTSACVPGTDDVVNACVIQCVPITAPAGHPLAPPSGSSGIKSPSNPTGKEVKDIECGAYHILARCTDNTIQAWGLNSIGQCNVPTSATSGTGSKGNLKDPSNPWLTRIVGLHAGYGVSAVSFNDGSICAWGDPEVAPIINGWTDIMMSPVQHGYRGGVGTDADFQIVDNVDPDKPHYARPQYEAAYNASATDVWNIKSDPFFEWHNSAEEKHCVPFFDLGVETDPHHPFEHFQGLSGYTQTSYGTVYPGWPFIELAPGYNCEVTTVVVDPASAEWKRWLDQRLRNNISAVHRDAAEPHRWTSCCELEIKKDFAVALRRTGQVITSRSTNAKTLGDTGNPGCPTGHTDGRSHCRDCSADYAVTCTCSPNSNGLSGCGAPGSYCSQASCACCITGYNVVGDCVDCSTRGTRLSQRFNHHSGCVGAGGTTSAYSEGIGCVSTNPKFEQTFFNHEWATPWFTSFTRAQNDENQNYTYQCTGQMIKRWVAGEQVRTSPTAVPPVNEKLQERFGWSTLAAQDNWEYLQANQVTVYCTVNHSQPQRTSGQSVQAKCREIDKDDATGYAPQTIAPDFASNFWYPLQMRYQSITCGTNTTVWQTQKKSHGDLGYNGTECSGCSNLPSGNISCAHNSSQYVSPNFGHLGYGVIYAGDVIAGKPSMQSFDKWGMVNEYRYRNGDPCGSGGPSMYKIESYGWPSRPWGPAHLWMWGSIGMQRGMTDGTNGTVPYPTCHCCTPSGSDPSSDPMKLPPPYILQSNADFDLDGALGMVRGFPYESNMHCSIISGSTSIDGNWCDMGCDRLYQDWLASSPSNPCGSGPYQWSSLVSSPFCAYPQNRATSWASSRMAYAMIRPDHRDCERDPDNDNKCVTDAEGKTVRATPQGKCLQRPAPNPVYGGVYDGSADNSQFIGCRKPDCSVGVGQPVFNTTKVLHIWGSLWDPCSPFPRLCDCWDSDGADPAAAPASYPFDKDTDWPEHSKAANLGDYETPCNVGHPEKTANPAPEAGEADTPVTIPYYPKWTRRPAGASRVAAKGSWSNGSASATWTVATPTAYESQGPVTRYCPNCDELTFS